MRYERFIDRIDKKKLIDECSDFKPRLHGMPSKWTFYSFVLALLAVIILVIHMSIRLILLPYDAPTPTLEIFGFLLTTSVVIIGIAVFSSFLVKRIGNYITETEFQSLLFASSISGHTDFYIIVNRDKIVVYYDYHFAESFPLPEDNPDAFKALIGYDGIKEADKESLTQAIAESRNHEVSITLKTHNGKTKKAKLISEPLKRPAGYSIIRGVSEK